MADQTFSNVQPIQQTFSDVSPIGPILHAPPGGTIQQISSEDYAKLSPADRQRILNERLDNEATALTKSGQLALGGGGLQNVAADEGASLLRWLYNNPKVKPVIEGAIKDFAKFGPTNTLKAIWDSWGQPLAKSAGGGLKDISGEETGAFGPSRTLPGMHTPESTRIPVEPIPQRSGLMLTGETPPAASAALPPPSGAPPTLSPGAGESIPRTLSGESALRQILTGQDNANLLKIARSRGINVTKEALLKPGTADSQIINKILGDFSDGELDNVRSTFLQNLSKHNFGDIGPEAWKTMSMQTYFPDVKIPQAVLTRTAKAISSAAAKPAPTAIAPPAEDLTGILQESVKKARQLRELQ